MAEQLIGDPCCGEKERGGDDEVRGEEQDQEHLRRLAGLEVHRAHPDPESRSVDRLADPGGQRQQQGDHPEEQERVPVALEGSDPFHGDEGDHERGDAHRGPDGLDPAQLAVEPGDRHEPHTVQQRGDRQQHLVGIGREPSDGKVGDDEESEDGSEDHPQVGGHVGLLGQLDEEIAERRDDDREQAEAELGPAAGRDGSGAHGAGLAVVVVVAVDGVVTVVVVVVVAALRRRT